MNPARGLSSVVIAIDGPSGAGKSTVSKTLAERLRLSYVDTGAMYRAVALKSRVSGIMPDDSEGLEAVARNCRISFRWEDGVSRIFLDGKDISDKIREPEISLLTSKISSVAGVRRALVDLQRSMGKEGGIIMDGRDVGTVIFPDAGYKFFLDASLDIRGKRRHLELSAKGTADVDEASTVKEMAERDQADSSRAESPLKKADDAFYIDTSEMSQEEVVSCIEEKICLIAKEK